RGPSPLDALFAPESVAIFGATEDPGSPGRTVTFNLIRNTFGGVVYPINPRRSGVLGGKAYPNLAALPEPAELAGVAPPPPPPPRRGEWAGPPPPAPTVPDILAECLAAKVKAAIVLPTGLADGNPGAADLEPRVREVLRGGSMRVLGMGSFGVACPRSRFNAT